ncbi:hypothetical protein [Pajaroellobacter abortibovis]|uniref:Uncharacterized protein n=1 Tax=Pajaroellobacter abortibovis TaxID=1882918 RepID=A0A1L6MW65_9BACT|nr:hypothetical protein [Pajaroellobacter abortibovis]APR99677.1 hypothetical protein BCY86_02545 [Pajaroellobacter abortibovis]
MYTGVDKYLGWIDNAIEVFESRGFGGRNAERSGFVFFPFVETGREKGEATATPSSQGDMVKDMGMACQTPTDCSTEICVVEPQRRYCSWVCGRGDRCLPRYHYSRKVHFSSRSA